MSLQGPRIMAVKRLTKASIDRFAKPQNGRIEISDIQKGLFLHVRATGTKGWVVVYRVAGLGDGGKRGQRVKLHLGDWPSLTIDGARELAQRVSAWASSGLDPREELAREKDGDKLRTVQAMANAWLKAMRSGQATGVRKRPAALKTINNREAILRRQIIPLIGTLNSP